MSRRVVCGCSESHWNTLYSDHRVSRRYSVEVFWWTWWARCDAILVRLFKPDSRYSVWTGFLHGIWATLQVSFSKIHWENLIISTILRRRLFPQRIQRNHSPRTFDIKRVRRAYRLSSSRSLEHTETSLPTCWLAEYSERSGSIERWNQGGETSRDAASYCGTYSRRGKSWPGCSNRWGAQWIHL